MEKKVSRIVLVGILLSVFFIPAFGQAFSDVPAGHWAFDHITAIWSAGITSGCTADKFCPNDPVTREQMAVFIVKSLENKLPVMVYTGQFSDVENGRWSWEYIYRLAEFSITSGCQTNKYCPTNPLTRDQMAVFMVRAIYGDVPANSCYTEWPFTDVPPDHWACGYIKKMRDLGITGGCGNGAFCPGNTVTRDQMAVFLNQSFLNVQENFDKTIAGVSTDGIAFLKDATAKLGGDAQVYVIGDLTDWLWQPMFLNQYGYHSFDLGKPVIGQTEFCFRVGDNYLPSILVDLQLVDVIDPRENNSVVYNGGRNGFNFLASPVPKLPWEY